MRKNLKLPSGDDKAILAQEAEERKKKGSQRIKLERADYVALAIAGLETVLLPIVILIAVLFVLLLVIH